jgi:uncharacterized zinc-type alcohol dehydrogenase-like protein
LICENGATFTYNSPDKHLEETNGGYSTPVVVDENFILRIPENLTEAATRYIMMWGVTTWSPTSLER